MQNYVADKWMPGAHFTNMVNLNPEEISKVKEKIERDQAIYFQKSKFKDKMHTANQ